MQPHLAIPPATNVNGDVIGPRLIGPHRRLVAFLPDPNARERTAFAACVVPAKLAALRPAAAGPIIDNTVIPAG